MSSSDEKEKAESENQSPTSVDWCSILPNVLTVLGTLPLLLVLVSLLYLVFERSQLPVYSLNKNSNYNAVRAAIADSESRVRSTDNFYQLFIPWTATTSNDGKGNADEYNDDGSYQGSAEAGSGGELLVVELDKILYFFLAVGSLAICVAAYLSYFVPRKSQLISRYLESGQPIRGDIFSGRDENSFSRDDEESMDCFPSCCQSGACSCCTCCCSSHRQVGLAVYPHPHQKLVPFNIQKHIPVHEAHTREDVTLLLLPTEAIAFSAQCQADLEHEASIIRSNQPSIDFLRRYAWGWTLFALLVGPLYILFVATFVIGDKLTQLFPNAAWTAPYSLNTTARSMWLVYIGILVVVPLGAFSMSHIRWARYYYFMIRGDAQFFDEGEFYLPRKSEEVNSAGSLDPASIAPNANASVASPTTVSPPKIIPQSLLFGDLAPSFDTDDDSRIAAHELNAYSYVPFPDRSRGSLLWKKKPKPIKMRK
jgi:hypothetical protein